MDDVSPIVAIIPARGGSKRLPRKNLLPLSGKPLISWTIEAAQTAGCFAEIVVSSDDHALRSIACDLGAVIHERSPALATDQASSTDVILDVLTWLASSDRQYRTCVLLQPTSPLRSAQDIREAVRIYSENGTDTVISVSPLEVPGEWCGSLASDGTMIGFKALSSDASSRSPIFRLNGAIYVFDCQRFHSERRYRTRRTVGFVMPPERGIDIDTASDLAACEAVLAAVTV